MFLLCKSVIVKKYSDDESYYLVEVDQLDDEVSYDEMIIQLLERVKIEQLAQKISKGINNAGILKKIEKLCKEKND